MRRFFLLLLAIAPGDYTLVYSTYTDGVLEPETYTATFSVAGEDVPFEIELDAEVYPYQGAACTLDINDGIRIATTNEIIRYSNIWSGNADSTALVSVKDVTVVETQGTGDWEWTPGGVGLYTFKHTTMTDGLVSEDLTVQFYVLGTMTDATVSLAFTECLYDGTAVYPTVVVTQGDKTLVEGLDYTVSYALNSGARDAKAVEQLAYDWSWHDDAKTNTEMKVLVQKSAAYATTLASGLTGVGEQPWSPVDKGQYTVTLRTYQLTPGNYRFVWNAGANLPDGTKLERVAITVEAK